MTTPTIPHAADCKRPAPTLRLSWRGTPELHCPACGRTAPDDTRTSDPKENDNG